MVRKLIMEPIPDFVTGFPHASGDGPVQDEPLSDYETVKVFPTRVGMVRDLYQSPAWFLMPVFPTRVGMVRGSRLPPSRETLLFSPREWGWSAGG